LACDHSPEASLAVRHPGGGRAEGKKTITMCGIVGSIQTGKNEPFREQVRRAMDHMVHRGPDGKGFEEFVVTDGTAAHSSEAPAPATVLFGHRRLAIIDVSETARQPMATPDGRFHLIFNGEIYNYREIGAELKSLGYTFRTRSDAEVLLLAWQRWGIAPCRASRGCSVLLFWIERMRRYCWLGTPLASSRCITFKAATA